MKAHLSLHISKRIDDASGREIERYTPVFTPDACASGSLTFAFFEAWTDEPETRATQQHAAIRRARAVLQSYFSETY